MSDFKTAPIHQPSADTLAANGLTFELVDTDDRARFAAWMRVTNRGFHGGAMEPEVEQASLDGVAYRRTSGVYDPKSHDPAEPVGTVNSWIGKLTVPGEREAPAWAISSVTVAPTHRRRGIARALLEAELATAHSLGVPVAMLTVSESTIYGRFGFAPAAMAADWSIDAHRVKWTGPPTIGRVDFITIEEWRAEVEPLWDRTRLQNPGQIDVWPRRWDQIAGIKDPDKGRTSALRAVRHVDDDGITRGLALFRISGGDNDFISHKLSVEKLISETPDAYAALWHFLIEMDLVQEVFAHLRMTDEPLRWQLSDWRGAKVSTYEHQYLRILDVEAAFSARAYAAPGKIAFDVTDPLGYAQGTWLLTVRDDGAGFVESTKSIPNAVPALSLSANGLAALYLGAVQATNLKEARLVMELHSGSAVAADQILSTPRAPWLGVWY